MSAISEDKLQQVLQVINKNAHFNDLGVLFTGSIGNYVLRECTLPRGLNVWMILEEETSGLDGAKGQDVSNNTQNSKSVDSLAWDSLQTCSLAALDVGSLKTGLVLSPVTAGASMGVVVVRFAPTVASVLQCGISPGRVVNGAFDTNLNNRLESETWFKYMENALDIVGLASAAQGVRNSATKVGQIFRAHNSTGRAFKHLLRDLNRAERKLFAEEMSKILGNAETIKRFKEMAKVGVFPKIFSKRTQISRMIIEDLSSAIWEVLKAGSALKNSVESGALKIFFVEEK